MSNIQIKIDREEEFEKFLALQNFEVTSLDESVYKVVRGDELPVFVNISDRTLYFEVDLGNVSEFADKEFYFKLLDLNTEILPVSFGINNSNPDDPRLVLVETRETKSLNDHELLCVFDALELAVDKAELVLSSFIGKDE